MEMTDDHRCATCAEWEPPGESSPVKPGMHYHNTKEHACRVIRDEFLVWSDWIDDVWVETPGDFWCSRWKDGNA